MKIVLVSLFKRGLGGGEGRVAHEMGRHFAAHHDVVMICPADETGLHEGESGLKVFGIQSAGQGEFWLPDLSGRIVSRIFDLLDEFSPDVIHAHEPTSMGLVGQVWARMHLVPFVHTTHVLPSKFLDFGATDALDVKLLQSSLGSWVTQRVLTDFYENCDAIVALNYPALNALREFGYEGRIFVIPNGRDLEQYGNCANAKTGLEEKILTFIGYISERKNQAYLLEMMRHLPETYKLQLIGKPLNPDYGQQLRDFCKKHSLDNVTFTGQIPHAEIPSFLERSNVLVSASKMEVQSLVVIEALASGTPVVGLSNETIDEFVDSEVGRWLPKNANPERFAQSVEAICTLPQAEYDRLCTNARNRVKHLDWSSVMALTIKAYKELLREKPAITEEEEARLADLVSFLPSGDVREALVDRINAWERTREEAIELRPLNVLLAKMRAAKRVPRSTWMFAGLTILISAVGYFFMKYLTSISWLRRSEE